MSKRKDFTRDELIAKVKEVASRLQKNTVSRSESKRETGISQRQFQKYFESWNDFVQAAGLQPVRIARIDDDELFRAMRGAFMAAGKITTQQNFRKYCRYSDETYVQRWGGRWKNVLFEFRKWAEANAPDFPYMADLPAMPLPATSNTEGQESASKPISRVAWDSKGGRQFGPFLNFRGLQHAPINEQGVVFLFGMVALELGFVVESITTGYPDCEAKRQIEKDKWERVRIEFEYESRNFQQHGHDPAQCDLIVCWIHNWPDKPEELDVLE